MKLHLRSRYGKSYDPITRQIIIQAHELKSHEPFTPMLNVNIQSGEIKHDKRKEKYWLYESI